MINHDRYVEFCASRNLKKSTRKGYETAITLYEKYTGNSIDELINEARLQEEDNIPLKKRKIKTKLINFRTSLIESDLSPNTAKTYFSKIKSFYKHYEIEIPTLPRTSWGKIYETNYLDLPTRIHIQQAIEISAPDMKAIILFMTSSGTAKAETLSLTVEDFINATYKYHKAKTIQEALNRISTKKNMIPTFYLKRKKTNKYYYTFCSPEAATYIVKYLKTRTNLKAKDKLFPLSNSQLINRFQKINDQMNWGWKGKYRFFRAHTLRKFHASNIGLIPEYIDLLQGRGKNEIHETYIKTNPEKLKIIYREAMDNILIFKDKKEVTEEFRITINLLGEGYEIIL